MVTYDRDSFLAGFAVGRTLWRPHTVTPGPQFHALPVFRMNEPVDVYWTYGTAYEFTKILHSVTFGQNFPTPGYWMLWYNPTESASLQYNFLFFSPDMDWDGDAVAGWSTSGYEEQTGSYRPVSGAAGEFGYHSDSDVGRWRKTVPLSSYIVLTPSQFFDTYEAFVGSLAKLDTFFESARLIQGPDQLYIVGETS